MSWNPPMTATAGSVLTAAQWNTNVRDNLNETCVAKATTPGSMFVATGANAIAERIPSGLAVTTEQTTTSTTYTDLTTAGPAVTVTTGTKAIVGFNSKMSNDTNGAPALASYAVSGATTVAASDSYCLFTETDSSNLDSMSHSWARLHTGLTAGSNTFTMKYRAGSGTARYSNREIWVIPL